MATARCWILVIRVFLQEQNQCSKAAANPECQLKLYSLSSLLINSQLQSPTVYSYHSLGIVQTVCDMQYYSASIAQAIVVIGSSTSLVGRGQALIIEGTASGATRAGWPQGTKWKLPLIKLPRVLVILSTLYLILVVRRSKEQRVYVQVACLFQIILVIVCSQLLTVGIAF